MDGATREELVRLAALGRERGLARAVRWIMARMAEMERVQKRRGKRKVRVHLVQGGEFWMDEARLKDVD